MGSGVKEFYNREFYDEIIRKSEISRLLLIKGTPGIGKSLFLQSFLVYLVQRAKNDKKPIPSMYLMRHTGINVGQQILSLLPDGRVIEITNDVQDVPDYLLLGWR